MSQSERLSRRTVLQGAGAMLALPLLEAMQSQTAWAKGEQPVPLRFAALYMPNGVRADAWTPRTTGSEFELSPILSPLAAHKNDLLVLSGLGHKAAEFGDGHYAKVAPFLSGVQIAKTTGSDLHAGVSMDQIAAQRIGNMTPLPSLELSVEPVTTGVDVNVGFTRLYGSHISWSSPETPVTREINPQLAFDRLFRQAVNKRRNDPNADRSVLDLVMDDAKRLQKQVSAADRHKLNEYYESVRSVETRIAWDAARRKATYASDPKAQREVDALGQRLRDYYSNDPGKLAERQGIDHTEQVRLMLDIIALAFYTDQTRVATFMFGNEVSGRNFAFIPGVSGSHHEISHHENDPKKLDQYERIAAWHIAQYTYLLDRLASFREGNGTILDRSFILFGSGLRDGNSHDPHDLPIVLAGRGGNSLTTGRHLAYTPSTPLCNLFSSLLNRLGAPVEHIGDSTGELAGLSA